MKGSLTRCLAAEAVKSRHSAPPRLALLMPLPMAALGLLAPFGYQSFSPWNYWYAIFLPVCVALVTGCAAQVDARCRMRRLRGSGTSPALAWWAKALWCLALSALSCLVVLAFYLLGALRTQDGLTAAGAATMCACALVNVVTVSWMIPTGLALTERFGLLAGIFVPLGVQLAGGFAWSTIPLPQLFPPSATMVIPTSFIPVLPSGEPLGADTALGGALAASGTLNMLGLAVCAGAFLLLCHLTAHLFSTSEEHA